MPSDSPSDLHALLARLDSCWVDPATASPVQVVEMLTERQRLLDRLASFDLAGLAPKEADAVRGTLEGVRRRDEALAAQTQRWQETLLSEGSRARQGRRGAEGYRRVVETMQAALERIA